MSVAAAPDWDSLFKLDRYCINEVEFGNDNIIKGNVRYCFSGTTPNYFVYSDASGTGCGAHMTLNQEYICHTGRNPFNQNFRAEVRKFLSGVE